MKWFLIVTIASIVHNVWAVSMVESDIDFDTDLTPNTNYPDSLDRNIEQMVLREMAEDEPTFFNEKENRIRDTLTRSTHEMRNRRTLSQMIPILRSLSPDQRLAVASLIASQAIDGPDEKFNLKQVETIFGERRNFILPVINDIAGVVRDTSDNKQVEHAKRRRRNAPVEAQEKKSYHERKFNMTNFRGTRETPDQQMIESQAHIHVSLPNAAKSNSSSMSWEEIENLALKDLNGTTFSPETRTNANDNDTMYETLPEPEQLVRPYRVRPRPIAEKFDNIYLYVSDYPIKAIMGSIRRHQYAMSALLAENPDEWKAKLEELEAKKRREDGQENSSSGMCPTLVRYARPQKARSASGEWKYIVNTGQHTQTLRLEKCSSPDATCTYLTDNFSSRCAQVYNYHRLLSWDHQRGLHIDIFKVPTCCSCQIDGYREKFPPIADQHQELRNTEVGGFQPSEPLYAGDGNDYSDSEDSPSSFRPIIATKKNRYEKRKKTKRPTGTSIDSYLMPSTNDEYNIGPDSFKRKQSSISVSLPNHGVEKKTSEVLVGSDELPEIGPAPPIDRPIRTHHRGPPQPPTAILRHQNTRSAPSKVLIKRVNYNYHPIIDFFFRDRAMKMKQMKDSRPPHML